MKNSEEKFWEKEWFGVLATCSCVAGILSFVFILAFLSVPSPALPGFEFFLFGHEIGWQLLLLSGFVGMEVVYWLCPKRLLELSWNQPKPAFVIIAKLICFCGFCGVFWWVLVLSFISTFFESFLIFAGCGILVFAWYWVNALRVTVKKRVVKKKKKVVKK